MKNINFLFYMDIHQSLHVAIEKLSIFSFRRFLLKELSFSRRQAKIIFQC